MTNWGRSRLANQVFSTDFLLQKLAGAKVHFERALDCKHTEFDDLYPYMLEHPQFFWYKRYVAWSELLTLVNIAEDLQIEWKGIFTANQVDLITRRVMSSTVLDSWFSVQDSETISGKLEQ
jgi:hypothetical protein